MYKKEYQGKEESYLNKPEHPFDEELPWYARILELIIDGLILGFVNFISNLFKSILGFFASLFGS